MEKMKEGQHQNEDREVVENLLPFLKLEIFNKWGRWVCVYLINKFNI